MRKLVVSEWVTLDGVLDADSMDVWFNPYHSEERAAYITKTVHGADALLLGRVTYEMLASYWPYQKNDDNGPAGKLHSVPKYVVSSTLKKAEWKNSTIINESIVEEIAKLKQQPGKEIQIEGSPTLVQSLSQLALLMSISSSSIPLSWGAESAFSKRGWIRPG